MGRRRKYFNVDEQKEANRRKVTKFYWNNKELCDKKARDYYKRKKLKMQEDKEKEIAELSQKFNVLPIEDDDTPDTDTTVIPEQSSASNA